MPSYTSFPRPPYVPLPSPAPDFVPQVTTLLHVDVNRTDTGAPCHGSICRPYRELSAAWAHAARVATEVNRVAVMLWPGRHHLAALELTPYVDLYGMTPNTAYLDLDGEVVAPTSMNLGGATLANLLVTCSSVDPGAAALRVKHRGNVFLQNVYIFSSARGIVLEGDSVACAVFLGVSSLLDAVRLQGTSFMSFEHCVLGSNGPPYFDLAVEAGAAAYMDNYTWFQNQTLSIAGTTGSIGNLPGPVGLADGSYHLAVAGGAASWVAD